MDNDGIPDLVPLDTAINTDDSDLEIEADLFNIDHPESGDEYMDGAQPPANFQNPPTGSKSHLQHRAYVLLPPSRFKTRQTQVPAPPPANSTAVDLPGRDPDLPKIYQLKTHPLAPEGHSGRIYIAYVDYTLKVVEELFKKAANMSPPTSRAEMEAQGEDFYVRNVCYCS